MQSQGLLTIEQMCRDGGVSRAGFYRDWEEKAPDQAAMALRDAIQRASLEHPRYGGAKVVEVLRRACRIVSLTRRRRCLRSILGCTVRARAVSAAGVLIADAVVRDIGGIPAVCQ
jgi:hypothetical protein